MLLAQDRNLWLCHLAIVSDQKLITAYREQQHTLTTVRAMLPHASGVQRRRVHSRLHDIERFLEALSNELQRRGLSPAA